MHVAIIMDGNGRWARSHGRARAEGHRAGARAVDRVVRAAPGLGISTLTLFALSSDNWRRPPPEIESILEVLRDWLDRAAPVCALSGERLTVIGRRDRLPLPLLQAIERAEAATMQGSRLHLRLAVDYSSREAIVGAARAFHVHQAANGARDGFGRLLAGERGTEEVDLLVRTGGEQRLSDFLLWESAYAELVFSRRMWPDFDGAALRRAVETFRSRERRFGGIARSDAG